MLALVFGALFGIIASLSSDLLEHLLVYGFRSLGSKALSMLMETLATHDCEYQCRCSLLVYVNDSILQLMQQEQTPLS
jgi:hypothetical protein